MATYIKTLKEDNGDIVYPQTITNAIYTSGGQTLETEISKYVTAEDIAQSVASFGTVTGGMIADNTISTSKVILSSFIDLFYPVGSYYETSDTTFDPNVSWTGTWVEDTAGKVLVSKDTGTFATVGDTGGSETYSHYHWQSGGSDVGSFYDLTDSGATSEGLRSRVITKDRVIFNGSRGTNGMRQTTTYSANTSSIQPYIVVKRWHRTA